MEQLKQQIPFLGLAQLRDFNDQQQKRLDEVQRILKRGQGSIDQAKAATDANLHGAKKKIGSVEVRLNHPWDKGMKHRLVEQITGIRNTIEQEVRAVMQKMLNAKVLASEYQTRHWTKIQVLNRANVGNGVNATDSLMRRAAYAEVFKTAGKAQLHDFGQLAIDTGDAVLADSVFRAVASLPSADRPFPPASLLALVPNAEFEEAKQLLNATMDAYDAAKRGFDTFMGGRHGQVTQAQIAAALRQQQQDGADDFNINDILDDAGAVREDALVRLGKRASGN